jgi:hypothetical protein
MYRGCISLGGIQCDECHRVIPYLERYLVIEETEDKALRFCIDCCLKKGYAHHKIEKGKQVLTLFEE